MAELWQFARAVASARTESRSCERCGGTITTQTSPGGRPAFTTVELLVALLITGLLSGLAVPRLADRLARWRVDSAAAVLVSDFELALSLSARQGTPVRIGYDPDQRTYRFTDRSSGVVLHSRRLGPDTEFPVSVITFSSPSVDVYPRRVTSTPFSVTLRAGDATARVELMPSGLIRVDVP